MKKFLAIAALAAFTLISCGKDKKETTKATETTKEVVKEVKEVVKEVKSATVDLMAPTLDNKGIGPIKSVTINDKIDDALVAKGKEVYKANCTACHKFKKRYIGPALKDITKRRSSEWIMNMILNSTEMLEKDPVAKALIAEYNAPMAQQKLSKEDARAILEFFRTK